MFENYIANKEDFEAIEKGIKTVWHQKIDFIFKKRFLIKNVVVLSYDSCYLYFWTQNKLSKIESLPCKLKDYHAYKIPHKVKIEEKWQTKWMAYLPIKEFIRLLPKSWQKSDFKFPKISGGLLTPFLELQKRNKLPFNAYTTFESYLATVIHEYAHAYYNQHRLWWYSDKKENLTYLETALKLFRNQKVSLNKIKIKIPTPQLWGEVFAFCSEYWASGLFWPNHTKNLDQMNLELIEKALIKEGKKNLDRQNSIFDDQDSSHLAAAVFGKIILQKYPTSWSQVLLKTQTL